MSEEREEMEPYDFMDFHQRYQWLHWKDCQTLIFDLETTGFDPKTCNIIQVAAQLYEGEEIIDELVTFINPQQPIPEEVQRITGINDDDVSDAPLWEDVAEDFHQLMEMADMYCGHNIYSFDLPFLKHHFGTVGLEVPKRPALDTMIWSVIRNIRRSEGVLSKTNQGATAAKYGCARMTQIAHGVEGLHNALVDIGVNFELKCAMGRDLITDESIQLVMEEQAKILPTIEDARAKMRKKRSKKK